MRLRPETVAGLAALATLAFALVLVRAERQLWPLALPCLFWLSVGGFCTLANGESDD